MSEAKSIAVLKDALASAKQTIREQGAILKLLTKEPPRFATVVAISTTPPPVPALGKDLIVGAEVIVLDGTYKGKRGVIDDAPRAISFVRVRLEDRSELEETNETVWFPSIPGMTGWHSSDYIEVIDGVFPRLLETGDKVRIGAIKNEHARPSLRVGDIGTVFQRCDDDNTADSAVDVEFEKRGGKVTRTFRYVAPLLLGLVGSTANREGCAPVTTIVHLHDLERSRAATGKPIRVGDIVTLSAQVEDDSQPPVPDADAALVGIDAALELAGLVR